MTSQVHEIARIMRFVISDSDKFKDRVHGDDHVIEQRQNLVGKIERAVL